MKSNISISDLYADANNSVVFLLLIELADMNQLKNSVLSKPISVNKLHLYQHLIRTAEFYLKTI